MAPRVETTPKASISRAVVPDNEVTDPTIIGLVKPPSRPIELIMAIADADFSPFEVAGG